jgi:protein-tyrosine phosphatase
MYVDCHVHILPGVDDGARDWPDALEMARIAVREGTSRLFATPHGHTGAYHVDPAVTHAKTAELNDRIAQAGIQLHVLPGMELHHGVTPAGSSAIDLERLRSGAAVGLGGGACPAFLLLEFSFSEWPSDAVTALRLLRKQGVKIVLAHPERYDALKRDPSLVDAVLAEGAWLQLTSGSILGKFGQTAQGLCRRWLAEGKVSVIASDAHSADHRPPGLREAFEQVREWGFGEAADRCIANADAIWEAASVQAGL